MSGKNTGHLQDRGKSAGHECPFSSAAVQTPPRSGFHSISGQHICTCADQTSNGFLNNARRLPLGTSTQPGQHCTLISSPAFSLPIFPTYSFNTHTHTHPSPSSPVQISIPALEKPSPLILQQFKPDPQHGLL